MVVVGEVLFIVVANFVGDVSVVVAKFLEDKVVVAAVVAEAALAGFNW